MHPRRHAHAGVVARARITRRGRGPRARDSRGPSADPGHTSARRLTSRRRPRRERAQPLRRPPGRRRRRVREVPAGRVRRDRPRIRLGLFGRRRFLRRPSKRRRRRRRRGIPRGGRRPERRRRERPAVAATRGARRAHPAPSRARGQRRRRRRASVAMGRRRRRRPRARSRPQGVRRGRRTKVEGRHAAATDASRRRRPVPPRRVREAPVRCPRLGRDPRLRVQPRSERRRPARAVDAGGCGENDAFHPAQGPSPRDPRRRRR